MNRYVNINLPTLTPFFLFCHSVFYLNEQDCIGFQSLISALHLRTGNSFSTNSSYSRAMLWIRNKLNRHLGFLLEAVIEAFPQSMLQIVAIVVYQEANYISIASILLSMFSVMTKSLILSQGIDKYTFIWTWLCAVTDFFGIFFILSWAFYSNEHIYGEYYGFFNIFGIVWFWKFVISVASIAATGCVLFALFGYWVLIGLFLYHEGILLAFIWCCLGPILCVIIAFGTCLALEVMCFGLVAFGIFKLSTSTIHQWGSDNTSATVEWMLEFISNAKYKPFGMLAVGHGISKNSSSLMSFQSVNQLIKEQRNDNDKLMALTYKQIRNSNPKVQSGGNGIIRMIWNKMIEISKRKFDKVMWGFNYSFTEFFFEAAEFLIWTSAMFLFGPLLCIGKIIQVMFPYFILGYLVYFDLLIGNEIDSFQLVMLWIYIGLQLVVCLVGIKVFTIHKYLYHLDILVPKRWWCSLWTYQISQRRDAHEWYDAICWYPEVVQIVFEVYGSDIGPIIMDYCKAIQL